jgi:16S rRNA (uracil1498-N3)-methyltransferase
MTRRCWIADEVVGNHAALIGAHAGHLSRVLRARVGQEFDVVAGPVVRRGRIVTIADDRVEFELGEEVPAPVLPAVTLLLAIFKFDRMGWAIEKCTELGVARIVPVIARRSDAHLATAAVKRVERWRRVAHQASEQARRLAPPEVSEPMMLDKAVKMVGELRILLSETERAISMKDAFRQSHSRDHVLLAVGPEGGWTSEEAESFATAGWIPAHLGQTILRAETAAIAAVAVVMAEAQE